MFLPTNITLKLGDSGDFVTELQRRLSIIKCFNESAINGVYDGLTVNGVSHFQSMIGVRADGIAGPETLRRLNGAISGDWGSGGATSDNKAEEEALLAQRQAELAQRQAYLDEQARLQAEAAQQAAAQQQQYAPQAAYQQPQVQPEPQQYAHAPQPQYQPQQHAPQEIHVPHQQQYQQHQPQQYQQHAPQAQVHPHQPQQPAPVQDLASQLLAPQQPPQQPQQYQQQVPHAHQPVPQALVQHQQPAPQQPIQHHQPAPQQPQPTPQQQYVDYGAQRQAPVQQQHQPVAQQAAPTPAAPEQPRGIVGRAMQYANEMVQKLANYFESKLPNHVIDEVKQIGLTMAKSGVKEVPIPTGPEQQRSVEGPAQGRGQQQARTH